MIREARGCIHHDEVQGHAITAVGSPAALGEKKVMAEEENTSEEVDLPPLPLAPLPLVRPFPLSQTTRLCLLPARLPPFQALIQK